jgi:maleate isomerase
MHMSTQTAATNDIESPLLVDRQNMPYELADEIGYRCRIGLIVLGSDRTIEHEFRKILDIPGVAFYESRIQNDAEISPETLAAMEGRIAECTRVILPEDPMDVVAYGCTSGAMVIGPENVHARIHEARPGVACTSPMEAAAAAFRALGAKRICLIAPYVDEINRKMRDYIIGLGFKVPVMGSWNISDDAKVARITSETTCKAAKELASGDEVDAVFVSCTSMHLAESVEALEHEIGKPVLSSNIATAWHCLRLAGYEDVVPGFGELFRRPLASGD